MNDSIPSNNIALLTKPSKRLFIAFALASTVAACGGGGSSSNSNDPVAATPSPTPIPSATPAPTATPSPTADPSPTPVALSIDEQHALRAKPVEAPAAGSVYKDFEVNFAGGNDWRVTEADASASGARNFLPNPVLSLAIDDLDRAASAQVMTDYWGGHPKTTDRVFTINGAKSHYLAFADTFEDPSAGTQNPPDEFYFQYTSINTFDTLAESGLIEGSNTISGSAESDDGFWGQWGWYRIKSRIFYSADKTDTTVSATVVDNKLVEASSGDSHGVTLNATASADATEVRFFLKYQGVDINGAGYHNNYHITMSGSDPQEGLAAAKRSDGTWTAVWDTTYVPDQADGGVSLYAVALNADGYATVSEELTELSLVRSANRSVRLFEPYGVYQWHGTENNDVVNKGLGAGKPTVKDTRFWVNDQSMLEDIAGVSVFIRTWNGKDIFGKPRFKLNCTNLLTEANRRECEDDTGWVQGSLGTDHYFYQGFYDLTPQQYSELKLEENTIYFESIWDDYTKPHHPMEILWPGPTVIITYDLPAQ